MPPQSVQKGKPSAHCSLAGVELEVVIYWEISHRQVETRANNCMSEGGMTGWAECFLVLWVVGKVMMLWLYQRDGVDGEKNKVEIPEEHRSRGLTWRIKKWNWSIVVNVPGVKCSFLIVRITCAFFNAVTPDVRELLIMRVMKKSRSSELMVVGKGWICAVGGVVGWEDFCNLLCRKRSKAGKFVDGWRVSAKQVSLSHVTKREWLAEFVKKCERSLFSVKE